MSNPKDEVRTSLVTNEKDPLAAARANPSQSDKDAAGRRAFTQLVPGGGGYDSLTESGKMAFQAYGMLPSGDDREPAAKGAALDAVRDAKLAGLFDPNAQAVSPQYVVDSKDPAVRNQSPTGTPGESSGPVNSYAPSNPTTSPTVATPGDGRTGEPNTTTPAVKGSTKL